MVQQSVQRKRMKTTEEGSKGGHNDLGKEALRRKSNLFDRKEALNGKLRSYKIRMYPTAAQKGKLRMWYAASNRAYNSALDIVKGMPAKANLIQVRKRVVPKESIPYDQRWVEKVPSKIRARAVKQLVDAQHLNLKEKGFGNFKMRYRSYRKDPKGTIILEKAFARDNGPLHHFSSYDGRQSSCKQKKHALMYMAPSCFQESENGILIQDRHWLIDKLLEDGKLKEDGKIMWDKRTNRWYLIVLIDKEVKKKYSEAQDHDTKVVSLDPGVRSFNTFYSPDGSHGELLIGATNVAMGMCKKMDKIRSDMDKIHENHKRDLQLMKEGGSEGGEQGSRIIGVTTYASHRSTLAHMRHRFHALSARLRDWRTNAHYDAINFLLGRYNQVLIPEFQSKRMAAKAERNISSQTVRRMFTMSHFMFRSRLIGKAELDENKMVRVIGEPGTSKTCGNCGHWNSKLGGSKTYNCLNCGIVLDRDVNGARNNMLALIN